MRNYLFLKIYATSEGVVSHNVLYYQQLSAMLVTKSVFKLVFVLSNYQTCTLPFKNILKEHQVNITPGENNSAKVSKRSSTFLNLIDLVELRFKM